MAIEVKEGKRDDTAGVPYSFNPLDFIVFGFLWNTSHCTTLYSIPYK